jgi:hypothetical protein
VLPLLRAVFPLASACALTGMGDTPKAAGSGAAAVLALKEATPRGGASSDTFSHASAAQKALVEAQGLVKQAMRHLTEMDSSAEAIGALSSTESQLTKSAMLVTKLAGQAANDQMIRVRLDAAGDGTASAKIVLVGG